MMTPISRYNKIQLSSKVSKRILNKKKEVYRPHQSHEQQYIAYNLSIMHSYTKNLDNLVYKNLYTKKSIVVLLDILMFNIEQTGICI